MTEDKTSPAAHKFWENYLETIPVKNRENLKMPEAWWFGDGGEMADELGSLVLDGIKTATASLFEEYETGHEKLPQAGDLSIILDGNGQPLCLIETTSIEIKPFDEVSAEFAYDEGEGDRSLEYWRQVHRRFFGRTCVEIGKQFSEEVLVVCERFKLVYRP